MSVPAALARILAATMLLGGAALLPATQPARADDMSGLYRRIGSWDVRVDSSVGYGCFIIAGYRDGTTVRIGIDNRNPEPDGYLMLVNEHWRTIESGKTYPITLSFEDASSTRWNSQGTDLGGSNGLIFKFRNAKLFDAIAQRQIMRVQYSGKVVTELPLSGTAAALGGMFECQKTFNAMPQAAGGPFGTPVSDPFAR